MATSPELHTAVHPVITTAERKPFIGPYGNDNDRSLLETRMRDLALMTVHNPADAVLYGVTDFRTQVEAAYNRGELRIPRSPSSFTAEAMITDYFADHLTPRLAELITDAKNDTETRTHLKKDRIKIIKGLIKVIAGQDKKMYDLSIAVSNSHIDAMNARREVAPYITPEVLEGFDKTIGLTSMMTSQMGDVSTTPALLGSKLTNDTNIAFSEIVGEERMEEPPRSGEVPIVVQEQP